MRQTTGIQDGKFRSYWHFDSRADFLANRSRLPENLILEYEPLFPPPPPTPHPVLLLRVTCQTGLLRGETRLHHVCPDGRGEAEGVTQWIDPRRYKLAKTKIPIPGDGWQERCMREVLGMAKGVLEAVYDGDMIALGDWCGFAIDGETVPQNITLRELTERVRVSRSETETGIWRDPIIVEPVINKYERSLLPWKRSSSPHLSSSSSSPSPRQILGTGGGGDLFSGSRL